MSRRVVVTGLGAVTPIGNNVDDFWASVKAGKIGFDHITKFDTTDYKCHIAAELKDFNPQDFMDRKAAKRMEPFSQYAVAAAKEALPLAEQIARARESDCNTGFPFEQALAKKRMSFICEVKKASPSKGLIAPEFPYVQIAKEYEAAGADAISVLTESAYFQGKNEYLTKIRQTVQIPLLRKDFTVDEYMI